mmetsp:Transcript_12200/g.28610  ORF Transcript_12200/g.28610 Transcript_12200/m.28610 type:complete len:675 (-) Transcript_12200:243-2267(-)
MAVRDAFVWGLLSAVSLPLGACVALVRPPSARIQCALMAFGAGALINALTLELFGHAYYLAHPASRRTQMLLVMTAAALAGGALFSALDKALQHFNAVAVKAMIDDLREIAARNKRSLTRRMSRRMSSGLSYGSPRGAARGRQRSKIAADPEEGGGGDGGTAIGETPKSPLSPDDRWAVSGNVGGMPPSTEKKSRGATAARILGLNDDLQNLNVLIQDIDDLNEDEPATPTIRGAGSANGVLRPPTADMNSEPSSVPSSPPATAPGAMPFLLQGAEPETEPETEAGEPGDVEAGLLKAGCAPAATSGGGGVSRTDSKVATLTRHGISDVMDCVARGDVPSLRELLSAGPPCDLAFKAGDYDARTALHVAAAEGELEVVRFLVHEVRVDVNPADRFGFHPLDDALRGALNNSAPSPAPPASPGPVPPGSSSLPPLRGHEQGGGMHGGGSPRRAHQRVADFLIENGALPGEQSSLQAGSKREEERARQARKERQEQAREQTVSDLEGVKHAAARHTAVMIWLGIFIDAIPESLVIGFMVGNGQNVLVLVVSVFLSNFPEALSSSGLMRSSGLDGGPILAMWTTTMLTTGIGALVGALMVPEEDQDGEFEIVQNGIQAVAAGSMLTMIAQTMLPEAVHDGGETVGLATLSGFLCALLVSLVPMGGDDESDAGGHRFF